MNKPRILVVDDESDARSAVIGFLITRYDCDFKEAENGQEAVEFVKDNPCDVIILDIKMPKKSGISVIKEAKVINPNVDILIVSAYVSDDVAEEALGLGAADYVVKPLQLKALSMKLEKILDKRGQRVNKT